MNDAHQTETTLGTCPIIQKVKNKQRSNIRNCTPVYFRWPAIPRVSLFPSDAHTPIYWIEGKLQLGVNNSWYSELQTGIEELLFFETMVTFEETVKQEISFERGTVAFGGAVTFRRAVTFGGVGTNSKGYRFSQGVGEGGGGYF